MDYVIDGRAYRDCIANISEGGAFIETSRVVQPGKPITLSFSLFQDQQPIKVVGEVAWSSGTGIGVKLFHNAEIRQFCAHEVAAPSPPRESTLLSLDMDEAEEEGPAPYESVVQAIVAPDAPQAPHPSQLARTGRSLFIPTALPVWVAIILVAALLLLDRSQTNTKILTLTEKVDRTSQTLASLEPRLAALVSQANGPRPESSAAAVQSAQATPHADPKPPATQPETMPVMMVNAANPPPDTVYVVQKGDTLYRIALRFDVPSTMLQEHNHLSNPNIVLAGQRLKIPAGKGM